jgi:acyl-CoA reductase-like NAD-dependent aldehyde dehydrogenase
MLSLVFPSQHSLFLTTYPSIPMIRPVVSEGQYNKIWAYIDEAKDLGYRFLYGGDRNMVTAESGNVIRSKVSL